MFHLAREMKKKPTEYYKIGRKGSRNATEMIGQDVVTLQNLITFMIGILAKLMREIQRKDELYTCS